MKQGKTLEALAAELTAQKARKKDYLVDTRRTRVITGETGTELVVMADDGSTIALPEMQMQPLVHRQLGQHLKVRADFYDRLRGDHAPLFDHLVNGLLDREPSKQLLRTFAGAEYGEPAVARAFLSNRYRRIDNDLIVESILPVLGQMDGVQFVSCDVTDTRLYVKAVIPTISVDLNELITGEHKFLPDGGDVVQAGVVISNSEVGRGGLSVQAMLYRLRCFNGLITGDMLTKYHVGKTLQSDDSYEVFTDETLAADDHALMLKVRDTVQAAVSEVRFQQIATQFAQTKTTEPLAKPVDAMTELAQRQALSEGESKSVLEHLLKGGDLTQFGVINAVTRAAHDVDSYDRATELEELGSTLMGMPRSEWKALAAVGA